MIKKIALLALAVSTVFTSALAANNCVATLSGSLVFSGYQIKPTVTAVTCGEDDIFTDEDFASVTYGENINAGEGSVSVVLSKNAGDYANVTVDQTFTISPKVVEIKIDDVEKEKGTKDPDFTWTMAEVKNIDPQTLKDFKDALADVIVLERKNKSEIIANESGVPYRYEITLVKNNELNVAQELKTKFPNFKIMVETGYLTISKIKVKVAAVDLSKVYGKTDPKLTYVVTGNIAEENYSQLGDIALTREKGENAGTYAIAVSVNEQTDDYIITAVPGTFTIIPAAASVTVDDFSKVYGDDTPEFTYKVSGLVGKDVLKDVSVSCAECVSSGLENVGEYEISASVKAASNPNYKVTTTSGTLKVTPKAATVTVGKFEKAYGDKEPAFTFETKGLVSENEELELFTITRAEGEDVGTYKVSVTFAKGANPNYTLTTVPGTLTINPKDVTLTVTNLTKKYGESDPELEYTVEGLASFDGVKDVLKGVTLKRAAGENAGEYAITATVDAEQNPNYVVSIVNGQLNIVANNDEIVVTIKGHTKNVTYSGKKETVKGYDISTNNAAYSLKFVEYTGDSVVSGTNAGVYKMGLSADDFKNTSVNYQKVTFNVVDGALEISPKELVVSAKAKTITYGDEIPTEFEWVADGLLEGDELDNIHVTLDKTGILPVGVYTLVFDKQNPTNSNYVVTSYEANSLTVEPRDLIVSIANAEKTYGDADPEKFAYEITGRVDGDVLPDLILAREEGENVLKDSEGQDSSYRISAEFASKVSNNYKVKIRQGYFTIKPFSEKITVAIFGENIVMKYTGEEITVDKKFDLTLIPMFGVTLPEGFTYSKSFISYKGDLTVSGTEMGTYAMNLSDSDFVNVSPNFEHVSFVLSNDGSLVIDDKGPETSLAAVKGVKAFDLSSLNHSIQVSGSKVGERYAVCDMQGRVIRSGVVETANFDIPVKNAGIYMVRVGASAKRIRVK